MLWAADACLIVCGKASGVLERGEALIRLEGLRKLDDARHVLAAVGEIVGI